MLKLVSLQLKKMNTLCSVSVPSRWESDEWLLPLLNCYCRAGLGSGGALEVFSQLKKNSERQL